MTSRAIASIALGAAVLLGATGCAMISPQATLIEYAPAEGVNIPRDNGPVRVLSTLIVADEDGSQGNIVAMLVNSTSEDQDVVFGINGQRLTVAVGANERISLGVDTEPLLVEDLNVTPGKTVEVLVTSGGSDGNGVQIPVLTGKLPYLADLVPAE